jgi:hypothetical protein
MESNNFGYQLIPIEVARKRNKDTDNFLSR